MNLNQVTVPSQNLLKAVEFYQELGLRLIVDSIPRYARFVCPDGTATFSIHHVNELPKGEGVTIYFECKNLDEEVQRLKKEGICFLHDPIDQDWLWREAKLKDPDGNSIILYYGGKNRVNPPWRVE